MKIYSNYDQILDGKVGFCAPFFYDLILHEKVPRFICTFSREQTFSSSTVRNIEILSISWWTSTYQTGPVESASQSDWSVLVSWSTVLKYYVRSMNWKFVLRIREPGWKKFIDNLNDILFDTSKVLNINISKKKTKSFPSYKRVGTGTGTRYLISTFLNGRFDVPIYNFNVSQTTILIPVFSQIGTFGITKLSANRAYRYRNFGSIIFLTNQDLVSRQTEI
jgi:hypothetical protein